MSRQRLPPASRPTPRPPPLSRPSRNPGRRDLLPWRPIGPSAYPLGEFLRRRPSGPVRPRSTNSAAYGAFWRSGLLGGLGSAASTPLAPRWCHPHAGPHLRKWPLLMPNAANSRRLPPTPKPGMPNLRPEQRPPSRGTGQRPPEQRLLRQRPPEQRLLRQRPPGQRPPEQYPPGPHPATTVCTRAAGYGRDGGDATAAGRTVPGTRGSCRPDPKRLQRPGLPSPLLGSGRQRQRRESRSPRSAARSR